MKKLFYLIIFSILVSSCIEQNTVRLEEFKSFAYKPCHASLYCIYSSAQHQSSVIAIRNPWQGAKKVEMLTFIERGEERAPKNFTGQVIKAPAQRIVCLSSSYIAMLDAVGSTESIVGVSGIDFITNPLITRDKVQDVGYDNNIDFEKLVALQPSVVLIFALNSENTALTNKLRELQIPYMYVGDYVEQSPLAKAEWMIALSEIVDKRLLGEKKFLDLEYRYNSLKLSVKDKKNKPKVMINAPYRDIWFMPSTSSYMVQLINDAGGDYAYSKNTGSESMPITLEQAYVLASQSDIWLNTGWHNNLEQVLKENPKFKTSRLVTHGKIYNNNARQSAGGGSDFWERGVVEPHIILQDLINIFSGEGNDKLHYYKQLQ